MNVIFGQCFYTYWLFFISEKRLNRWLVQRREIGSVIAAGHVRGVRTEALCRPAPDPPIETYGLPLRRCATAADFRFVPFVCLDTIFKKFALRYR